MCTQVHVDWYLTVNENKGMHVYLYVCMYIHVGVFAARLACNIYILFHSMNIMHNLNIYLQIPSKLIHCKLFHVYEILI